MGGQCILTPGPSVEADRPRPGPKACGQDQRGDSSGRVCGFGQCRASQTCPACVSTAAPQATMAGPVAAVCWWGPVQGSYCDADLCSASGLSPQ